MNDPKSGWNGLFRGKPIEAQVFAFWTRVRLVDGTTRMYKGSLTLVK